MIPTGPPRMPIAPPRSAPRPAPSPSAQYGRRRVGLAPPLPYLGCRCEDVPLPGELAAAGAAQTAEATLKIPASPGRACNARGVCGDEPPAPGGAVYAGSSAAGVRLYPSFEAGCYWSRPCPCIARRRGGCASGPGNLTSGWAAVTPCLDMTGARPTVGPPVQIRPRRGWTLPEPSLRQGCWVSARLRLRSEHGESSRLASDADRWLAATRIGSTARVCFSRGRSSCRRA